MDIDYLHTHSEFDDLIRIVADELSIVPVLVEKDYWIMHCLHGLQAQGMVFYLKGGTSLSKGHNIIHRFSEDIDIVIEPPTSMNVVVGKNQNRTAHRESRRSYYDWLAENIKIKGVEEITRDTAFDDEKYRSGGIRLHYPTNLQMHQDVKSGILLEVGFDTIAPNSGMTISSWAYDFAETKVPLKDNRAFNVSCYHPGYTLIEKLQTISTKFRKQQTSGTFSENFMRHYYDVYHLLAHEPVVKFIGTKEYHMHKKTRFRASDNHDLTQNQAFQLGDGEVFEQYNAQYKMSQSLYYKDKPSFEEIIARLRRLSERL